MLPRPTVALAVLGLAACERAKEAAREKYYDTLEKVGVERREVLVNRVDNARVAQEKAQKQFRDALEEFQALVGSGGGELGETKRRYEDLVGVMDTAAATLETDVSTLIDEMQVSIRGADAFIRDMGKGN